MVCHWITYYDQEVPEVSGKSDDEVATTYQFRLLLKKGVVGIVIFVVWYGLYYSLTFIVLCLSIDAIISEETGEY